MSTAFLAGDLTGRAQEALLSVLSAAPVLAGPLDVSVSHQEQGEFRPCFPLAEPHGRLVWPGGGPGEKKPWCWPEGCTARSRDENKSTGALTVHTELGPLRGRAPRPRGSGLPCAAPRPSKREASAAREMGNVESQRKENMFSSKQDQKTGLVLAPTPSFFI